MLSIDEALERILGSVTALPAERVGVGDAVGRVLAETIVARRDLPPEDNSAVDGYAVRADDVAGPARLKVVGTIAAGAHAERALRAGEAYRIMTGAAMPEGADAVVMQEVTRAEAGEVEILEAARPRLNVRPRGDDVHEGDAVVPAGVLVGPAEVAAIVSQGRTLVSVVRRPRVAVLSSGDELVEPDEAPTGGRIVNSNNHAVAAACRAAGAEPVMLGTARDTPEAIGALVDAARGCDVVVSSGGVSVGEFDFVKDVFESRGLSASFWKVAMKPGKPLMFGLMDGQPVFGLPGNPVSAQVTFEVFVRPALLTLGGRTDVRRPLLRVRLTGEARGTKGRQNMLFAHLTREADGWTARPVPRQGSHRMGRAVDVHALVPVPPDTTLEPGAEVDVWVLRLPGL